jgi:hypothetical protein
MEKERGNTRKLKTSLSISEYCLYFYIVHFGKKCDVQQKLLTSGVQLLLHNIAYL